LKRTLLALSIVFVFSPATFAQTRGRSTASRPKPAATPTPRVSEVRTAGANRVAEQIKLLAKFIYILGGTNSTLTAQDESIRRNDAGPDWAQKNQQAKNQVRNSITGFREALDKLEIDFRSTPELQPYYIKLAGVASGAANAEQLAANNQFDAAGRSLLNVVYRLADVLVTMRQ
jgi:hypothetical protein